MYDFQKVFQIKRLPIGSLLYNNIRDSIILHPLVQHQKQVLHLPG